MPPLNAKTIIEHYGLEPLDQEGGFFRQVWRSERRVANETLGAPHPPGETHPLGTLIYFLLTTDSFSSVHRLPTPEHWFYHLGDPAEMLLLHPDGNGEQRVLGPDLAAGQAIHLTTPANSWQGTRLLPSEEGCGFCLVSCVMVPGFEWTDFAPGDAAELIAQYPEFGKAIRLRTRPTPTRGKR
ncbi:MAG: cupin domain-containing protein [Verrucomicrobia bacterium]|jgi:predicted cupin superfamily sugar epimerase|nr:cupin domain-containing protein [Verrucomicrobiota bacterium]